MPLDEKSAGANSTGLKLGVVSCTRVLAAGIAAIAAGIAPASAAPQANFSSVILPTSFIGEAATLALAFAAPALCAGGYLLLKRAVRTVGVPVAIGAVLVTAAGGVALTLGANPELLTKLAGL